jgi:hypothetical protein
LADDSPFIPPLGDFTPPVQQADAAKVVALLLQALTEAPDDAPIEVDGGTGKREGRPWFGVVWVQFGESKAFMAPETARKVAAGLAGGPAGALAPKFTAAADEAERLAKAQNRKELH